MNFKYQRFASKNHLPGQFLELKDPVTTHKTLQLPICHLKKYRIKKNKALLKTSKKGYFFHGSPKAIKSSTQGKPYIVKRPCNRHKHKNQHQKTNQIRKLQNSHENYYAKMSPTCTSSNIQMSSSTKVTKRNIKPNKH